MSTSNCFHLLSALGFFSGAVLYTFGQRLFGRAPHWPHLGNACPMSPFSRWLLGSFFAALGLGKIAEGLFHPAPSIVGAALFILFLIALAGAYRHDRRLARAKVT